MSRRNSGSAARARSADSISAVRAASASTAPRGRVPSHAAAMAATTPSTWPSQHSPAVWRSTPIGHRPSVRRRRPSGSGPFVEHDVGGDPQRRVEESLVRGARRASRPVRTPRRGGRRTASTSPAALPRRGTTASRRSLPHRDEPEPDRFDVVLVVVRHPLVVFGCPVVGRLRLSEPTRRVGARFQHLAFEHERVAPRAVEPPVQPVAPVLPATWAHDASSWQCPPSVRWPGPIGRAAGTSRRRPGRCRGTGTGATARSRTAGWPRSGRTARPRPDRTGCLPGRPTLVTSFSSMVRVAHAPARGLRSDATTRAAVR